jgi:4-amino-4-deoxy-L-arabinose transferase-like glycosyltransferase
MSFINRNIKQIIGFARREVWSIALSILFSIPIALSSSELWFNILGEKYSFKNLLSVAPIAFVSIFWIVWLIASNFLNWIKTKHLNLNWRNYIALGITLISLIAAAYYGWNSYGWGWVLDTFISKFKVEITSWDNSPGNICVLEIKDQRGEKVQLANGSISALRLTGDWITEKGDCQFFSPGSLPGSLEFDHVGKTGEVFQFLFRENQGAGKALVRVNGEEVAETDLFSEQEGSTLITTPMYLSRVDTLIWNIIGTAGLFALPAVLLMLITLFLNKVHLLSRISTFSQYIEHHPWIGFVPVVVVAIFMFWPRGFFTSPDAAYYLSLAKNLYHGNGYVNPDLSPNIYRGPVFPFLIYLSYLVFGESFLSAVIMERIFWVLTILISYLLGKQLYNHRVGFLAAFFILTAGVINETFIRVWTDGPLTFAILVLLLMFWQAFKKHRSGKWYALMGAVMGITYLLKQTVIFIAPLPLLIWIVLSEHRTRQTFKKLLLFYTAFALFYFGWMGYVYLAGGSSGQITGTLKTVINFTSYISRGLPLASAGQNTAIQEEATKNPSIIAGFFDTLDKFYTRDIQRYFRLAIMFPTALAFILYQAVGKRRESDIILALGFLLYTPLILVQTIVNFGFRQNLYFYCITLFLIAVMLDRIFDHLTSKGLSHALVMTVAASLIFIQFPWGVDIFPKAAPVKNQKTLDYLSNYQEIATWVDEHVKPDEKIMLPSRESNYLHILTSGNRQFATINTCIGEVGFSPAEKCTPPYISFWIYKGTTDPEEPRDLLQGISEPVFLSTIRKRDVKYVFVTPPVYSLYYYLKLHPDFEEIAIIDNIAIFRVIRFVQPISNYPNLEWTTCIGKGTSEYLKNLKNADPLRYKMKLQDLIEPWMGLTKKDLEAFINWQGCQFEVGFPGSYSLPLQTAMPHETLESIPQP